MKLMLKKLVASVVIGMLVVMPLMAVQTTFTLQNTTGLRTNLVNAPCNVTGIIINNGAAVAVNYAVIDGPQTNATFGNLQGYSLIDYSNGPSVGITAYLTNLTKTITNFSGITTNIVSSNVLYSTIVTNVAATNAYRIIAAGQIPASTTLTLPISSLNFGRGVTITNSATTNSTVTLTYSPSL